MEELLNLIEQQNIEISRKEMDSVLQKVALRVDSFSRSS